jgi:hypothetical protein
MMTYTPLWWGFKRNTADRFAPHVNEAVLSARSVRFAAGPFCVPNHA